MMRSYESGNTHRSTPMQKHIPYQSYLHAPVRSTFEHLHPHVIRYSLRAREFIGQAGLFSKTTKIIWRSMKCISIAFTLCRLTRGNLMRLTFCLAHEHASLMHLERGRLSRLNRAESLSYFIKSCCERIKLRATRNCNDSFDISFRVSVCFRCHCWKASEELTRYPFSHCTS